MLVRKYSFKIDSNNILLEDFMKRYHFDASDYDLIKSVKLFLAELVTVEVGIQFLPERIVCATTLGKCFDQLENVVEETKNLMLSYCMECFAMEFLSKSYERINEFVYKETGKWLGAFDFLDEKNFKEISFFLEQFEDFPVSWKQGMLHPLKSVFFLAEYKSERQKNGCMNCEQCNHYACEFRNIEHKKYKKDDLIKNINTRKATYSYGISRIFGGEE